MRRSIEAPSGIVQGIDGSRSKRDLDPLTIGAIAGLVAGFTLIAVSLDTKQSPKQVLKTFTQGTRYLLSKDYREQIKKEEETLKT